MRTLQQLTSKPKILQEFEDFLIQKDYYDKDALEILLYTPWKAAYPEEFCGDDLLVDIQNFLYAIGDFIQEKVFNDANSQTLTVYVVTEASYEMESIIAIVELKTKTLVAYTCFKTWHLNPNCLEDILNDLLSQARAAKTLISLRLLVEGENNGN